MDISDNVPYYRSYGIESGGLKHTVPRTAQEKMCCPAMKFVHGISDFTVAGVKIACDKICLNYDRKGNILIGMDILQEWDIHMGISKVTEKNLFLASPRESICQEYLDALAQHFGDSI